jgi:hypothetical protein
LTVVRLFLILVAVVVVCEIFALVSAALADPQRVRGVPKVAWVLIILFVPVVGTVLWFTVGRPRRDDEGSPRGSSSRSGGSRSRGSRRPLGPDDDPDFLNGLRWKRDDDDPDARG